MSMTWDELAAAIAEMPVEQRTKPVRILEPYDSGAEMLEPDMLETYDSDCRAATPIPEGEYYLS